MASSTCPRPAKARPRLLWAIEFCEVQANVWVHKVSLSRQYRVCCQAHTINPATTSAATAANAQRR